MTKSICTLILLLGIGAHGSAWAQEDKAPASGEKKEKVEQKKHPEVKVLSPEERDAKRKEMRERMQKQLSELRKKKADGTLSEAEKKRLERMEEINKRFDQAVSTNKVGNGKGPNSK